MEYYSRYRDFLYKKKSADAPTSTGFYKTVATVGILTARKLISNPPQADQATGRIFAFFYISVGAIDTPYGLLELRSAR